MIYSYPDTLLEKWVEWCEGFLSVKLDNNTNDLNTILGTTGSDNPSRANEFYNIGCLNHPLTTSPIAYDNLRLDKAIQSDFGYLCFLISKTKIASPSTKIDNAFNAICSLCLIQQYEEFKNGILSLNSILLYLIEKFPLPQNCDEKHYLRYLSAAMFCELNTDKEKLFSSILTNSVPPLQIIDRDTKLPRATFNSSNDIKLAIDGKVSLTGIVYEKGSTFFIGNPKDQIPRGLFYSAYNQYKDFLKDCYEIEILNTNNNPFLPVFQKSPNANIILLVNSILKKSNKNHKYLDLMKSLQEGCIEAIKFLNWDNFQEQSVATLNTIFYGAPGTGKSHKVENILKTISEDKKERVTFHPEFDNASFVGGYKPISELNTTKGEDEIKYKFVPQTFINIYVNSWKDLDSKYYLAIEEINRGNCAEIFGELFQLLDRNSNYSISPSKELREHLQKELGLEHEGIKGGKMKLPNNLILMATMNTSDQSLFPMDSAFKRRWAWEYVPINYDELNEDGSSNESFNYIVKIDESKGFKWIDFIKEINSEIKSNSNLGMDKCIGNYFIKASNNEIEIEELINKTVFYLWNDVFKDEENGVFPENVTYEDFFPIKTKGVENLNRIIENLQIPTVTL